MAHVYVDYRDASLQDSGSGKQSGVLSRGGPREVREENLKRTLKVSSNFLLVKLLVKQRIVSGVCIRTLGTMLFSFGFPGVRKIVLPLD